MVSVQEMDEACITPFIDTLDTSRSSALTASQLYKVIHDL
jgi:hypothetical protein